jgi:integrase/recombinase XerD
MSIDPVTLFDSLFIMPSVRNRHNRAPLARQRIAFLTYLRAHGRKDVNVRQVASHLLQISRTLGFSRNLRHITKEELECAGRRWATYKGDRRRRLPGKYTYGLYMRIARSWLRFHSYLVEPRRARICENRVREFESHLKDVVGFAATTIDTRARHASFFLDWLHSYRIKLANLTLSHVERYLKVKRAAGWALTTQNTGAYSLRIFLRYSEMRGWVRPGLSDVMPTFCRPKYTVTPKAPGWGVVRGMISSLSRTRPLDIRHRAMVLLMAVYGFRFGEVRDLQTTDVDFENSILTVRREKNWKVQRFPLSAEVARAIKSYLTQARPVSNHPNLFISFLTPHKAVTHGAVYPRTRELFLENHVNSLHKGPHVFRHACAQRLIRTGVSVRHIAAFLGHNDVRSVRDYARYDLKGLRQVAEFDLGDLL